LLEGILREEFSLSRTLSSFSRSLSLFLRSRFSDSRAEFFEIRAEIYLFLSYPSSTSYLWTELKTL
jgi:hypothetical protein